MFYVSKFQYRNKNRNFISNFVFQFIKKTKCHIGYTDFTPFILSFDMAIPQQKHETLHKKNTRKYGCSFGAKFMFLYSKKNVTFQRNIFLFRGSFIIFRETFSYSAEVLYSVNFFVFQKNFIFKEMLLCSVTFLLYSDKFFIFRKEFVFEKAFNILRKSLCSEKIFIFRENHEFKFQIV